MKYLFSKFFKEMKKKMFLLKKSMEINHLEQRKYRNDTIWLKNILDLKLPRFFTHRIGE